MVSPNTSTTSTTTPTTTTAPSEAAKPTESKRTLSPRNLLSRTFSAGYDTSHSVRTGRWHRHPPAVARRAAPAPAPAPVPVHHHVHSGEDDDDASTIGELPGTAPIAPLGRAVTVSYADLSYPSMTTDNRHGGHTDEYRAVSPTGVIPLVGSIYRPPTRDEGSESALPNPEEKLAIRHGHVVYEPEKKKKAQKAPEQGKEQEAAHHRRFSWTVCRALVCLSGSIAELVLADLVTSEKVRTGEASGDALTVTEGNTPPTCQCITTTLPRNVHVFTDLLFSPSFLHVLAFRWRQLTILTKRAGYTNRSSPYTMCYPFTSITAALLTATQQRIAAQESTRPSDEDTTAIHIVDAGDQPTSGNPMFTSSPALYSFYCI
ncbi:hypothetical protein EVG20_g6906 [Dentipellis fragilis]|uniref:Uncharacterized protein n=1 Tax=Dentipellis fragilis TaxID=205917 RepID=A0A4Y9YGZ6_9AGAM|nr:hypothetical protein EVG20_g6906 [Dentipellis fragilis]